MPNILQPGIQAVAFKIQEAALAMSHDDIRARLQDTLSDQYRGTGSWCYLVAVFGDDKAGDCVYSCNDDLKKAAYTCAKSGATIAIDSAVDVVPLTTYELESAGLMEAGARNSKRDQKQIQSIHDASMGLGATCSMSEAKKTATGGLRLVESAATLEKIVLREAKADYEIKLIAPGKGSSAIYPQEVLRRDGPNVFKAGTHVYLNHPTAAEEAARPEGDVKNLAGVLSSDAVYHESHAKGPGLYARMKVFADHATTVEEKAPHVGMSIRASGVAEAAKHKSGLPVLKELTHAESVDVVTRAGAGGMILQESALPASREINEEVVNMTEAEVTKLIEAERAKWNEEANVKTVRALEARALRGDAAVEANRVLSTLSLHESAKQRVIENCTREGMIPVKDGALDVAKFGELVTAEAKREAEYISRIAGGSRVIGMGSAPKEPSADEVKRVQEAEANHTKDTESVFSRFGLPEAAAKAAAKGRAA